MLCEQMLDRNRRWAASVTQADPTCFARSAAEHRPQALFIGCSDARVPVNVVTQTQPGELFVHRNIANLVVPTDTNLLAVLQYAVDVLRVHDVVVCGHQGCGGVKAAMERDGAPPLVEHWIENVRTVLRLHAEEIEAIPDPERRHDRLVELNVMEQVRSLASSSVVRAAWARGAELRIHGWVYGICDGLLHDLGVTIDGELRVAERFPAGAA